jgi:phage terminase small subunit
LKPTKKINTKVSMEALQNPKREKFAQFLAAGKPYTEAYALAGYKEDPGNACNLSKQPEIIERVQKLEGYAAVAASVTKERIVAELTKMAFAEVEPIKDSTKAKALETLAKIGGLTNDRLQVDVSIGLADLVNGSYKLEPPKIIEGELVNTTNEQEKPNDIKGE